MFVAQEEDPVETRAEDPGSVRCGILDGFRRRSTVREHDDTQIHAAVPPEQACTAVERGTGRENIINKDVTSARIQTRPGGECKGIFQVVHARAPVESGLGRRVGPAHKEAHRRRSSARRPRESLRQKGALVETAFPVLSRMKRHRNQHRVLHVLNHRGRPAEYLLNILKDMPAPVVLELDQQRARRAPEKHSRTTPPKGRFQPGAMLA